MGTSEYAIIQYFTVKDHPHAYGDKANWITATLMFIGSSPRVWGQVCKTSAKLNEVRIIPTRMGTSLRGDGWVLERKDHPHAYGDKL